jgi:hypothetical protein
MEQREQGAESKALALIQEFVKKFRSIDYTLHPSDIPGEAAGKGSNMAWAARKLSAKYPIETRKNVIVTGLDGRSKTTSPMSQPCLSGPSRRLTASRNHS